jgi:hypothetical protein
MYTGGRPLEWILQEIGEIASVWGFLIDLGRQHINFNTSGKIRNSKPCQLSLAVRAEVGEKGTATFYPEANHFLLIVAISIIPNSMSNPASNCCCCSLVAFNLLK